MFEKQCKPGMDNFTTPSSSELPSLQANPNEPAPDPVVGPSDEGSSKSEPAVSQPAKGAKVNANENGGSGRLNPIHSLHCFVSFATDYLYTAGGMSEDLAYKNIVECITRIRSKTILTQGMKAVYELIDRIRQKKSS
ncbi:hypothetical protein L1987_07979 [Smallanthus sonchifolius]|uniref:Uncharacterized protein n=1 Tax=Smallanthus sonchifolius TaxID=185202 RepID=A0ACB9JJB4_9ASTR|nr:hypothetical protein L1987_07979 [Smallanthus sonchifolius]